MFIFKTQASCTEGGRKKGGERSMIIKPKKTKPNST